MSVAAEAAETREFDFTKRDFDRVCKLIHGRAGIALSESKRDMVYSRLARRLRALDLESFAVYLDQLEAGNDGEEWQAFTNALTTNLTSFFREPHHFEKLAEFLEERRDRARIAIWCAAASTGEEPYSLAMTVVETLGSSVAKRVKILATDIDTNVLATAERGVYSLERLEKMEPERKRRFFRRGVGANDGFVRVTEELRELLTFKPLNLLDARYPMRGPFDAVFCRNVMIYFDKPTQREVLGRIVPLIAPDGLFFAGHSESFFHATDLITSCGRTIYRPAKGHGS